MLKGFADVSNRLCEVQVVRTNKSQRILANGPPLRIVKTGTPKYHRLCYEEGECMEEVVLSACGVLTQSDFRTNSTL